MVTALILALSTALVDSDTKAVSVPPRHTSRWQWPISHPHHISRGFEAPASEFEAGHRGIDIASEVGSIVVAPETGVADFAGWVVNRAVLSLRHNSGVRSSYEPVDALVMTGAPVVRGQPIATVASSHHCEKPCLHFGVRKNGRYVSPLFLLQEMRRAILVPVERVTLADAHVRTKSLIARPRRAYKSASFRGSSDPASPAQHADRHHRREDE